MNKQLLLHAERMAALALFGAGFAYCLWGAAQGRLLVPRFYADGRAAWLSGAAAWATVLASAALLAAVVLLTGTAGTKHPRAVRIVAEMALLCCALATAFVIDTLPGVSPAP